MLIYGLINAMITGTWINSANIVKSICLIQVESFDKLSMY